MAACSTACVGPARSDSDYLADVANTARIAGSAVSGAALTVDAVAAGKASAPYTARRLTEDEQTLQAAITAFGSVQPPSPLLDALRSEVVAALQDAIGVVADLRIAAFRGDSAAVVEIGRQLPGLVRRLREYEHVEAP